MTKTRSSRAVAAALLLAVCGPMAVGLALAPAGQSPQAAKGGGSRIIWHHSWHVYSGPMLPASQLDTPAHRL